MLSLHSPNAAWLKVDRPVNQLACLAWAWWCRECRIAFAFCVSLMPLPHEH